MMNSNINSEDDDLRKEAQHLFSMERKNIFQVPEGYFDSLSPSISDRISQEKKQPGILQIFQNIFVPKIAVPLLASVCLIAAGIKFFHHTAEIPPAEITVTYDDLYNSEYLSQIDERVFEDALSSSVVRTSNSNQDIENYLMENNVDVNDLSKELN